MKLTYKILRSIAIAIILLAILLPAALYVALSTTAVQNYIRHQAESQLTELLGADVRIKHIAISPFNRLALRQITVANPDTTDSLRPYALTIKHIGAGINLWDYFVHGNIVVNYAELIGADAKLYRDSAGAPLNIQPIIDAISPKDPNKPSSRFDLAINTVVIRACSLSYDVGRDSAAVDRFDPHHITVTSLSADASLPCLTNDSIYIDLRRMALHERSGIDISDISASCLIRKNVIALHNISIATPTSTLLINDQTLDTHMFSDSRRDSLPIDVRLLPESHISTTDIVPFLPALSPFTVDMQAQFVITGTPDRLQLRGFHLLSDNGVEIAAEADIAGLISSGHPSYDLMNLELTVDGAYASEIVSTLTPADRRVGRLLSNAGLIQASANASGTTESGSASLGLITGHGLMTLDTDYARNAGKPSLTGMVSVDDLNLSALLAGVATGPASSVSNLTMSADYNIVLTHPLPEGSANIDLAKITYLGYDYSNITADADIRSQSGTISLQSDCPELGIDLTASLEHIGHGHLLDFNIDATYINLSHLGLYHKYPARYLSFTGRGSIHGSSLHDIAGTLDFSDISWANDSGRGLHLDYADIACRRHSAADTLTIDTEIIEGTVTGRFDFTALVPAVTTILSHTMPRLAGVDPDFATPVPPASSANEFDYSFRINSLDALEPTVRIPVKILDTVRIFGSLSSSRGTMSMTVDAPYLLQGNKIIEGTSLNAAIVSASEELPVSRGWINFTTQIPTKNGPLHLTASADARHDNIDCHLGWIIDRERLFSGDLNLSAAFERNDTHQLMTRVNINPGTAVFNDTIWTVEPALITYAGKEVTVDHFKAWRQQQSIEISGRATESETDTLIINLDHVDLDYVFETLDIPTAMFGGNVTGKVYGTRLLTADPHAYTPGLEVKGLKYNGTVLGDALLRSGWNNDRKSVSIYADITEADSRHSFVDGEIFVLADSLDFRFDADRIPIGFLQTYMSAFANDVSGFASGKAHLWGTFKLIDMTGDIYGEDVRIKLGFTNTSYTTTDSIRLTPGRINIQPITISDDYGNKAILSGWLTHKCFKSPEFNFEVTDARNLLVYDVKETPGVRWFGRVFANGSARVSGRPGVVDIGMNMTTMAGSTFTYILSDDLVAQEYTFLTFRDRDQAHKDSLAATVAPPLVIEYRKLLNNEAEASGSSNYRLDLQADITPQAQINLVMDPVGGDCIRAHGSGNLRMTYDAANEDLRMNGTYVVDRGNYNFTLQDVIIKDFTLREGSSIAFHGDPYAAQLDIVASYQAKANLSDLDQSFLEDKELNRTNVPVDALLLVKGDMRQPEISFDLDFPTLTQETKRKVRSIINTEEMMNRQIIYLLALNRFYTPDYMNGTRGNELFSVASSTLASQLSNILGQLSDNWSIAPNLRSDRGDFSDIEVDLALSSHLLNNRLLLNGNFGYRDKSLNNNSFIGDFDIEYLLNPRGSWRLKAYNRYNDQNYYLKSALTTQGVGIVFKRDFDSFFSFLRRKKKTQADTTTTAPDTLTAPAPTQEPADTTLLQFR